MGWALRLPWRWFMKTDTSKPWFGLPIQIPARAAALFKMAVEVTIGNGEDTLFWTDKWLQGRCVADLALEIYHAIPKRVAKRRTVSQAVHNRSWVSNIKGALTVQVLFEYLHIWELLEEVIIQPDTPDTLVWRLSSSGCYIAANLLMKLCSLAPSNSTLGSECGRFGLLESASFLCGWPLALNNRCWTLDRRPKRGCPISRLAPCVTRLLNQSTMSSLPVCWPGRSGPWCCLRISSQMHSWLSRL